MKVSYSWLSDFIDIKSIDPKDLVDKLTMSGLEVEELIIKEKVENVVFGKVLEKVKHPDADKLSICKVYDGLETYQVICGAANVEAGQIVPFAKIGAKLPIGLKIKKAKIRGVESYGMICSAAELGLEEKSDGIMVLNVSEDKLGENVSDYLGLEDVILDISITPNRADCLSIYGVAREISALYNLPLKNKTYNLTEVEENAAEYKKVEVKDKDKCPIYLGRIIKDVRIKESPIWMQNRLRSVGVRPINNVVDITNYVLFEYGQPLHTFDMSKLQGNVIIRTAKPGEKIITLDGKERELKDYMLVIADEEKVVAVAGIMGGEHSGICDETKDVFLECAYFKPESIRVTARRLGMQTDSSYRFERGIDKGNVFNMVDYAAFLLQEYADGKVLKGVLSNDYDEVKPVKVSFNLSKVNKLLGTDIKAEEAKNILERLQFKVHSQNDNDYEVEVPTHRVDVERWVDIAEEIARIYGYEKIETTIPEIKADSRQAPLFLKVQREVRESLKTLGFYEAINFSFMNDDFLAKFDDKEKFVYLKNPLSEDMNALRTYVFPGLVANTVGNIRQGFGQGRFFELANVFVKTSEDKLPEQKLHLALSITDEFWPLSWSAKDKIEPFYYLKGIVENIFLNYKLKPRFEKCDKVFLHPGKSAYLVCDGETVGFMGELHPDIIEYLDIDKNIFIAEIFFEKVVKLIESNKIQYKKFSVFPSVTKDLSVVVGKNVYVDDMIESIEKMSNLIDSVVLYDVYQGDKIGVDKISLTFRIYFSSIERTLTDEETNNLLEKIIDDLKEKFGAELR
ncbi:phenylalanine--tRNA ligase subunit beta [Deferribacter autotrophicus]|uniref:Phenylalanine--tRNA ligase beta subunit n=1 Tax=Deferribacter autotrophicus TaxID=500465 RepID=A0A5A8F0T5_9BACT|nr:phenylalanine--tRNA ligase subunit beta [Deferribacter autotrophicus]KAA0257011.1 phenylalanine--tRNA ligase subunit beta [Deferribacter autotrophicus]